MPFGVQKSRRIVEEQAEEVVTVRLLGGIQEFIRNWKRGH